MQSSPGAGAAANPEQNVGQRLPGLPLVALLRHPLLCKVVALKSAGRESAMTRSTVSRLTSPALSGKAPAPPSTVNTVLWRMGHPTLSNGPEPESKRHSPGLRFAAIWG